MSLANPMGRLLTDIRDFGAVAVLTDRVKIGQPAPGWAKGTGSYKRMVLINRLGHMRLKHAPLQEVRASVRCYGEGANPEKDADDLAGAVSDAVHDRGHRITAGGVAIFSSFDDGGEGASADPDTQQPYQTVIVSVAALTSLVS